MPEVTAFIVRASASSPTAAFVLAVRESRLNRERGYIGDKDNFIMIDLPPGEDAQAFADKLINSRDPRLERHAGCIQLEDGDYLFFGWEP